MKFRVLDKFENKTYNWSYIIEHENNMADYILNTCRYKVIDIIN